MYMLEYGLQLEPNLTLFTCTGHDTFQVSTKLFIAPITAVCNYSSH